MLRIKTPFGYVNITTTPPYVEAGVGEPPLVTVFKLVDGTEAYAIWELLSHGSGYVDVGASPYPEALDRVITEARVAAFPRPPRVKDSYFRQKAPKGPFLWLTHAGELVAPSDMATPHLYYALRMIFNHSVPKRFRTPESIHPVKRYGDVGKWSIEYRKAAIKALTAELDTRNPKGLDQSMQDGLRWMRMATRAMIAEGL